MIWLRISNDRVSAESFCKNIKRSFRTSEVSVLWKWYEQLTSHLLQIALLMSLEKYSLTNSLVAFKWMFCQTVNICLYIGDISYRVETKRGGIEVGDTNNCEMDLIPSKYRSCIADKILFT